jgi:bacillithiol synthase
MDGRQQQLLVTCAPAGFIDRPEFAPRVPVSPGGKKVWLPRHPEFQPRLAPEPEPATGTARPALFQKALERFGIAPGPRARENLAALDDPRTRLVITGQQPAFLTGPLYTVFKAISAVAAAAHLESITGRHHVPVFWVAGEDHDLDEARSARLPGPHGATLEFSLPMPADRRPLSAYPVDRAVEEVIRAVLASLDGRRHLDQARALAELYRGRTLEGGFAAIIASLFEEWGLLPIEPEGLRATAAPIIRRALEEPEELLRRIEAGIRTVEGLGMEAQVSDRFPLFLIEDAKRHHLAFEGRDAAGDGRFLLEGVGRKLGARELLRLLDAEPGRFSTGVLLRPVVQNAVLPNAAYLGGPAEIAYFKQLLPVFEWFGLPAPGIALRLSATLIEGKVSRAMRRLGLWPASAEGARRWAGALRPEDLLEVPADGPRSPLLALAHRARGELQAALADPRLPEAEAQRLQGAAEKIVSDIEKLGSRASRAVQRSGGEDLLAAQRAHGNFFPDGVLQERRWNILYYVAKYGTGWIERLVTEVSRDPFLVDHRWVFFPGEAKGEEAGA